jgi:hypothetical protein
MESERGKSRVMPTNLSFARQWWAGKIHSGLSVAICGICTRQFLCSEFTWRLTLRTPRKNYNRDVSMGLRGRFPRRDSVLPNQDSKASLSTGHGTRVAGRSTKIRKTWSAQRDLGWLPTCNEMVRGRIPNDDLHESLSEGEGACSRICDGRSHLPLRGKLGWMTPRPGQ